MREMTLAVLALSIGASDFAHAACDFSQVDMSDNRMAVIFESCIADVPGIATTSKIYRRFEMNGDGQLMVFEFFGTSGHNSADSGSRTFYFFPVTRSPSLTTTASGQVSVQTASVPAIVFEKTGKIAKIDGAKFVEDPAITGSNEGGVSIDYPDGILLDCGWALGKQSIQNRNRTSTFIDPAGTRCSVQNSRVFRYVSKDEVHPLYKSASELAAFLRTACPGLDLTTLENLQTGGTEK